MEKLQSLYRENKLYWWVLVVLILLIELVVFITYFYSYNRIQDVAIVGDEKQASFEEQSIIFTFTRPMGNSDVSKLVTVSPEADYRTQWSGKSLVIKFQEPLKPDVEYSVTLDREVTDIYGDRLIEDYTYEFKTASQYLYYVKLDSKGSGEIVRSKIPKFEEKVIYSTNQLLDFRIKGDYLFVIHGNANSAKGRIVDLRTGEEKEIFNPEDHIYDAKFNNVGNEIWALQQVIYKEGDYDIPLGDKILRKYSVPNETLEEIEMSSDTYSIKQFNISPDGNDLLVQEEFSDVFALINPDDTSELSPIGKYAATGGYGSNGSKLLFVNVDFSNLQTPTWITLRTKEESIILSEIGGNSIDPFFLKSSPEKIGFSQSGELLTNGRAKYDLILADENYTKQRFSFEEYSLEYGSSSPDGRYIMLYAFTEEQLSDPLNFEGRINSISGPSVARIVLFDVEKNEFVDTKIETISARFD